MHLRTFRHRPGIALIVVLSVVLALLFIATPFVVSMIHHERSAKAYVADTRADLTAEWARTAAVTYLYNTHDHYERRSPIPLFQTFTHDPSYELAPDLRFAMPDAPLPRDALAGLSVQDEQGKVNLRSASSPLVQNLRELALASGRPVKDLATLYSGRDGPWARPQRVRAADGTAVWVDTPGLLCTGTKFRISKVGLDPFYGAVAAPGLNGALLTTPAVPEQYVLGLLEMEPRHPVNVLSAPREVLIALFQDLMLNAPDEKPLGSARAGQVADALIAGQPTSLDDVSTIVWGLTSLTDNEKIAITTNADTPTSTSLLYSGAPGGSMPLCFRSYDVLTIESTGAVIRAPGAPTSSRAWRDVVSLSPPHPLEWALDSQWDFAYYLDAAGGNPKIRTLPNATGDPDEIVGNPAAGFTLRHAEDLRSSVKLRESFSTLVEGKELTGDEVHSYPWGDVFVASTPNPYAGDVLAGGVELWFRFTDAPKKATLFTCSEGSFINRLAVSYDNGFLSFCAADSTLATIPKGNQNYSSGLSRLRVPFTAEADRWYHVAAYWKGTKFAQLCLMIDGFVPPKSQFEIIRDDGASILSELAAAAAIGSTTITLKDNSFIPTLASDGMTPIEIGREVVLFNPSSGTWLRGARGTFAADHPQGAKAALFGYAQKISAAQGTFGAFNWTIDRLTVGGGRNTYKFGTNTNTTLAADLIAAATAIVPAGAITDFPAKGYLLIMSTAGQEVVYYDDISGGAFQNVARAQQGTAAADHPQGSPVLLYSVAVDNLAGYLDPCIFQIDDEWFIARKDAVRAGFFIGPFDGALHYPIPRGICGSPPATHEAAEKVIPVFAGDRYDYTAVSDAQAGPGDRVTVLDASDNRELQRVRREWHPDDPLDPLDTPTYQLLAFYDWVAREYASTDAYARLLKFPSGELLSLPWLSTKNPEVRIGQGVGEIDEIKAYANPKGDFYALNVIAPADGVCTMNASGSLSQGGGAVKVGDEIIGYAEIQSGQLQRLVRGYLGSTNHVHDAGDRAFHLTGMLQISALKTALTKTTDAIAISQGMTICPEGYVLIDGEVLGYHINGGTTLRMPIDSQGFGLWRGRYGTTPALHNPGALVYAIPFRYWDTYAPSEWDDRMAILSASRTVPGARWQSMHFEFETEPADDANLIPHARARFGRKGLWTNPTDVFDWTTASKPAALGKAGDTMDVQLMFEYAPGSFYPNHSWKTRPTFRNFKADYDAPTQTLYHEE